MESPAQLEIFIYILNYISRIGTKEVLQDSSSQVLLSFFSGREEIEKNLRRT
jgi:hypothetical protein